LGRAAAASRDNAPMTTTETRGAEPTAVPIPRRGRIWVILALGIAVIALGYAVVGLSTQEAGDDVVRVAGISDAQRIFSGMPQEGARLGSADAPVSIQIFNDLQCSNCRDDFLTTIPALAENYARPGDVKLLMRHYSVAENPLELGFFGAEAAAAQGYGWQYIYLFFRNQNEAERFGIGDEFMASLAASVGEIDLPEWEGLLDRERDADGPIAERLEGYDELGAELGIRTGQAAIVSGPSGTRTLQEGPALTQIEAAIEAVQ
jgi:protein-disulfide isomerase